MDVVECDVSVACSREKMARLDTIQYESVTIYSGLKAC